MESSQEEIFPIVLPALLHVSNFHWNKMTAALANEVLQKFMRPGNDQFEKIVLKVILCYYYSLLNDKKSG